MSNTGARQDFLRDIECYTCGEEPSPLLMLRAPRIELWSTEVRRIGKEFKLVVKGQAKGHPEYIDGDDICTPAIIWFDRKNRFIRTAHRVYGLGEQAGEEIPIEGIDV
jgi:hypothetical protein